MEREEPLTGGWVTTGVVRVGDTVRRPRGPNADVVERLLVRLEAQGFAAVPRFLGLDEQGRQILSFIDGAVLADTGNTVFSDAQLRAAGHLLSSFHQVSGGFVHGDPGPWNMVWRDGSPFALFDFDEARTGEPIEDAGYAAWKFLNLAVVDVPVEEQGRRLAVFADACNVPTNALIFAVGRELERMNARFPNRIELQRRWFSANLKQLAEVAAQNSASA